MRLVWSAELETGVRVIDRQHEELVAMLNELDEAYAAGSSPTVLDDVLKRLDAYIAFHFATEESLLAELPRNESHTVEHLHQHRAFIERVALLRERALADGQKTLGELVDYLNGWILEHILKTDRKLAALLNARAAEKRAH